MIKVLDHGFVRLVDHMGSDLSIARAARVSYDAAWRAGENENSDARLIRYLWVHQHTTPFEAVEFQFEVKAPIFVLRQWHRHRTWTYNELSARYRELPEEYYVPDPHVIGTQSKDNKQARVIDPLRSDDDWDDDKERQAQMKLYRDHCNAAFREYRYLLRVGWPRELARMVLPLSTYSHMFAKVNLKNLFHFFQLRSDPHAQYEIRAYSDAMQRLVGPVVPVAMSAWRREI